MDQAGHPTALVFDLGRESPFFFKCQICGVCCTNKAIRISPYEALRLAGNLRIATAEIYRDYAEEDGTVLKNRPDGTCIFLNSRGCGVHPDRPLVCRLFPLGQILGSNGELRYGSMPLHPDCLGLLDTDGTVGSYLESQGAGPYFRYDRIYSALFNKISKKLSGSGTPLETSSPFDSSNLLCAWLCIDSSVASFCRSKGKAVPRDMDEMVTIHLQALEEWTAGL